MENMKKFDQKRDEIKKAGIRSFAAYGYYKTTLEDIAAVLGMKKNSLYYYFENKDALFLEIIQDTIAAHTEREKKILSETIPATEKLLKFVSCFISFIKSNTTDYAVKLSSFMEINKVICNTFPEFTGHHQSNIQAILDEGTAKKEFKPHNSGQLARDIVQLIPAIFNYHYMNSDVTFVSEIDFEPIADEITRMMHYITDGIRTDSSH